MYLQSSSIFYRSLGSIRLILPRCSYLSYSIFLVLKSSSVNAISVYRVGHKSLTRSLTTLCKSQNMRDRWITTICDLIRPSRSPHLMTSPRPNKVTYGCYPSIPHALRFTKGGKWLGKGLMPHSVVCSVLCISRILSNQLCIPHVYFRVSSVPVALHHISVSLLINYVAKRHDNEDEMGGASGAYGVEEHCIQDLNLILNWET
jgi:hypothetical protein